MCVHFKQKKSDFSKKIIHDKLQDAQKKSIKCNKIILPEKILFMNFILQVKK